MNARAPLSENPAFEQEFEASGTVIALVRETALKLGAAPEQAREAARTGRFELESHRVGVAANADEDTLLLSVDLGDAYFADPARSAAALAANMHLFVKIGVVFARGLGGPVLVGRWPAGDVDALANGVRQMAAIAQGFAVPGHPQAVGAPANTVAAVGASQE
ncbi:hypothetical protein M5C99_02480 [Acidovorax sp. NCPPB 2350]|nr:hypothetical protein M5C99_02480 [Acidovorax sp. NCPPB 2350]